MTERIQQLEEANKVCTHAQQIWEEGGVIQSGGDGQGQRNKGDELRDSVRGAVSNLITTTCQFEKGPNDNN